MYRLLGSFFLLNFVIEAASNYFPQEEIVLYLTKIESLARANLLIGMMVPPAFEARRSGLPPGLYFQRQ